MAGKQIDYPEPGKGLHTTVSGDSKNRQIRSIEWDGKTIQVMQLVDRGWEGILYRREDTGDYILAYLQWHNGAYVEAFRPMISPELNDWLPGENA